MDLLTHVVNGDGAPLLLLNGGLMTYGAWEPLAVPLAKEFRVVRCDFRGQLLSPGNPPTSLDAHADDLAALLDHLGIASAHVVGASFGALVATVMGARHPSRVRSLIAITSTDRVTPEMTEGGSELRAACRVAAEGGDGGRVFDLISEATWSDEFRSNQELMLKSRRQAIAMLPRSWFGSLEKLMVPLDNLDLRPLLAEIDCPALVVGGELDRTFPVEHSRALAAGITGARLVVLPRGSHGLCIERASEVVDLVSAFIRDTESGVTR